jgi:hypothetical protein
MAKVIVLPPNSLKRPLDGARIVPLSGTSATKSPAAAQPDPMQPAVDQIEEWLARRNQPENNPEA